MSKGFGAVFLLAMWLVLSNQLLAQTVKLPFKDVGACPFECCTYREWTVNKDTVLLKEMTDKSTTAFRVKKGEKVTGVTGVVITTQAGIGKAVKNGYLEGYLKDTEKEKKIRIKKGETFSLLTYQGEGFYLVSFKGVLLETSLMEDHVKEVRPPKSIWWVKVKNSKGQVGWTKLHENFDDMDACG